MIEYFKRIINQFFFLFLFSGLGFSVYSKESIQTLGDIFLVANPLAALGTTYKMEDRKGRIMWAKSLGVNALVTFSLKQITKRERPDGSDNQSFPSAHSSMTFHSAAYIHLRYNLKLALPFYAASIFTAYSRVYSRKHRTIEVVAGAMIGIGSSYYFTRKLSKPDISSHFLLYNIAKEEPFFKLLFFQKVF